MSKRNQYRQQSQQQPAQESDNVNEVESNDEPVQSMDGDEHAAELQRLLEEQQTQQSMQDEQEQQEEERTEGTSEPERGEAVVVASFAHGYAQLLKYVSEMAPNVTQTLDSLVKRQMLLIDGLNILLRQDDQAFPKALTAVIDLVRQHRKTVFSELMLFRAFPSLRITRAERQKIETLLTVLTTAADVKNPRLVKNHVNFEVLAARLGNDMQRQRLESYFGA